MSRNSRRTKVNPPTTPISQPNIAPPPQSNPFGIDLVAATEFVSLPSKGKFYAPGSSMHGVSEVEIRHMTAREEDILSNQDFILSGTAFDKVLKSILVDKSINPDDLIPGDRNAILYAARVTGYGNEYTVKRFCEACKSETLFKFDLDKRQPTHELPEGVVIDEASGTFSFTLPKTGMLVAVRILTSGDDNYLLKQNMKAEELNIENNKTINLFNRAVVSVNGVTDRIQLGKLFPVLPAIDSRKLRTVINSVSPNITTKQMVACGSCGEETESEVPFSLGFFWPDV